MNNKSVATFRSKDSSINSSATVATITPGAESIVGNSMRIDSESVATGCKNICVRLLQQLFLVLLSRA